MTAAHIVSTKKRPINISMDSSLLEKAKNYKINISACAEFALANLIQQKESQQWLAENQSVLEEYNQYTTNYGVFSDGLRSF